MATDAEAVTGTDQTRYTNALQLDTKAKYRGMAAIA